MEPRQKRLIIQTEAYISRGRERSDGGILDENQTEY